VDLQYRVIGPPDSSLGMSPFHPAPADECVRGYTSLVRKACSDLESSLPGKRFAI
jgi:hypothetical protein